MAEILYFRVFYEKQSYFLTHFMDWRLSHRLHVLPPLGRLAQEAPGHALKLLVCTKHEIISLLLIFLSFLALDSLIYLVYRSYSGSGKSGNGSQWNRVRNRSPPCIA